MSWPQVNAICFHVRRLPVDDLNIVDDLVARVAPQYVDQLDAARRTERDREPIVDNHVTFAPRLDGSGRAICDYDADHSPLFATSVDTHTTTHGSLDDVPDPTGLDHDGLDGGLVDAALTRAPTAKPQSWPAATPPAAPTPRSSWSPAAPPPPSNPSTTPPTPPDPPQRP